MSIDKNLLHLQSGCNAQQQPFFWWVWGGYPRTLFDEQHTPLKPLKNDIVHF